MTGGDVPGEPRRTGTTARACQRLRPTSSTLSVGAFTLRTRLAAYGRPVSGALENRSAVFASQPQAVEVYQAGAWWPGELLGWRHDDSGSCQVWVRVVLGGVEETAWTALSTLRLPERHLSVAPSDEAAGASDAPDLPLGRSAARLRSVSGEVDASATVGLPMVRERSANHPAGGRRRAPETGQTPVVQVQAPAAAPTAGSAPASSALPIRGRHRAPADPGRHRAADTGLFAVVSNDVSAAADAGSSGAFSAERSSEAATLPPRIGWTVPAGVEPDLLTRPMRLSDHVPHARRPRVDGRRPV